MSTIADFTVKDAQNNDVNLSKYLGKVVLIVNVASKCGKTPQYKGLTELYTKYRERGLEILAFPCNQFMFQEPGTEEEICEFAKKNYSVEFPIFHKIDVNGGNTDPLWSWLKKEQGGTLFDAIKWNFSKFLINKEGKPVKRYSPNDEPASIAPDIENLL